ncbi:aldo-keto reductase AKR2E4-like isoform X4 [Leptidea sinapis]|uniref:aldo-keto reductase AKR2E4-like isoform X4 n=1 Tax=Leptidea sinapis TaxID=189913 RepID=UPI0021C34DE9|nr:aldo-keto reductase AKR2E4-like isoform X4 [Leptidea sinapis]
MDKKVHSVKFNNGLEIPIIGLGTYSRNPQPGQFRQAVEWGIEAGYRHIDTASMYKNEVEVGEGIANKINQGLVTRKDLFITTKLWNDHHAENKVIIGLKDSLGKLQLDYLDLYLVHWPVAATINGEDEEIDYIDTWRGMEEAVRQGLTKSIGVSNFNEEQLARLLQYAKVKPVVNQIEILLPLRKQMAL